MLFSFRRYQNRKRDNFGKEIESKLIKQMPEIKFGVFEEGT